MYAVPFGSAKAIRAQRPRKEDRPMDDGSKGRPEITAGLDIGDNYSYLCLIDTGSGEVIEEGRLRTNPEALRTWPAWPGWIRSSCIRSSTGANRARLTWP